MRAWQLRPPGKPPSGPVNKESAGSRRGTNASHLGASNSCRRAYRYQKAGHRTCASAPHSMMAQAVCSVPVKWEVQLCFSCGAEHGQLPSRVVPRAAIIKPAPNHSSGRAFCLPLVCHEAMQGFSMPSRGDERDSHFIREKERNNANQSDAVHFFNVYR